MSNTRFHPAHLAPAYRALNSNTATPEQRRAAAEMIAAERKDRLLTQEEIDTMNLYELASLQGDDRMLRLLEAANNAHEDNRGAPMLGWLLLTLGVVIGAALAMAVLA